MIGSDSITYVVCNVTITNFDFLSQIQISQTFFHLFWFWASAVWCASTPNEELFSEVKPFFLSDIKSCCLNYKKELQTLKYNNLKSFDSCEILKSCCCCCSATESLCKTNQSKLNRPGCINYEFTSQEHQLTSLNSFVIWISGAGTGRARGATGPPNIL